MGSIWDEMRRMHEMMDRMFGEVETPMLPSTNEFRKPVSEYWETESEVKADIELPGVNKEDIEINADEDKIEVKVEKRDEQEKEEEGVKHYTGSYVGFYRQLPVPEYADVSQLDASYKNGILHLSMPKKEVEQQKRRRIEVK